MRIVTLACAGIALLVLCVPASALNINLVDTEDAAFLAGKLLAPSSGITITGNYVFQGSVGSGDMAQSGWYDGFGSVIAHPDGIFLTSGTANITTSNTSDFFGVGAGQPGDSALDGLVPAATFDANILEFTFTVDPGVTSIEAYFVFGTEEYPNAPDPVNPDNGGFPDVFGFFVDDMNYAMMPYDDGLPDDIVTFAEENFDQFNNNLFGTNNYDIEYDGFTNSLKITAQLATGRDEHTLRIAIADAGDDMFDSGVFIGNLRVPGAGGPDNPIVPEPASIALLGLGLAGLGLVARKRRRNA